MLEPAEIQGRPVGRREKAHRAAGGQGCPFPGLSRAPHSPWAAGPAHRLPRPCLLPPASRSHPHGLFAPGATTKVVFTWLALHSCHSCHSSARTHVLQRSPSLSPQPPAAPGPGSFLCSTSGLKAACAHLPHACTSRVLAGGAPRRPHSSAHPSSARPGPAQARQAGAAGKQRAGKAACHPSNLAAVTSPRASLSKSPAPGTRQCSRGRMHSLCGTLTLPLQARAPFPTSCWGPGQSNQLAFLPKGAHRPIKDPQGSLSGSLPLLIWTYQSFSG